jgi:hypothetical protein
MDYSPKDNYRNSYNQFGVFQAASPYSIPTVLPTGLVPNLKTPTNASVLQSGTPFTSEIEMQFGVIYAGVDLFPSNVSAALALTPDQVGYRLGLDVKDNNVPKFFIGGPQNFFFFDGRNVFINGQLQVYGHDNSIEFYDENGTLEGELYADDTAVILAATEAGSNLVLAADQNVIVQADLIDMMTFDSTLAVPAITAAVPFGLANLASDPTSGQNGQMYYNTATDHVRAYVAGAWVTVV